MAIKVFFHICAITRVLEIVSEMINSIHVSGLYEKVHTIYVYISGQYDLAIKTMHLVLSGGVKFVVIKVEPNDTSYERLTLEDIHKHVQDGDKILYIHSKGVSKHHGEIEGRLNRVDDWRRMMMYFLVGKHKKCIEELDRVQTVGINMRGGHYSGNFWWCRADYFLTLPHTIGPDYFDPELRFLFLNNPTYYEIYNTPISHYDHEWPYRFYVN